ncbi:MAG: dihydrolipoyl dehydrogenase family protein [Desulfosudaceae bacterium]
MINNPLPAKKKNDSEKIYDVVVIGSGSGMRIVENAVAAGLSTALVDKGPAGGTCLNLGCIPSKMMIAVADRVMEIRECERFGITAAVQAVDFPRVMREMRQAVVPDQQQIHENLRADQRFDFYEGTGSFEDEQTLAVNGIRLRGKDVFVAAGARPDIPDLEGLNRGDYLTSESLLQLEKLPSRLAIIGGGYIAAEYSHFFAAMGSKVTIMQRDDRLVPGAEPEVSEALRRAYTKRMTVHTGTTAQKIEKTAEGYVLIGREEKSGRTVTVTADQVLVASGRRSNADLLQVEKGGLAVDSRGFVQADARFRTSQKNTWAFGDIIGKKMFTHVAYEEAGLAWHNSRNKRQKSFDYQIVPQAVFSYPQLASAGLTEAEAVRSGYQDLLAGTAAYNEVAKGMALRENEGFAKAIVDRAEARIIGFHIIGPQAAVLIQEIVTIMAAGGKLNLLADSMHIHPALSELVLKPFNKLAPVSA